MGLWGRFMTGLGAFRQAFLNADTLRATTASAEFDAFTRFEARKLRYDVLWALYQNNAFWDQVHRWAQTLKMQFGLYEYTRTNFNPLFRLVEFHATHLVGGTLDPAAGDGESVKSALPILTDNEALRPGLATLWRHSRWAIQKDVWTRTGAALGDVGLWVCDDPAAGRVALQKLHPGHIKWVSRHPLTGQVTSYIREEIRYDPRLPQVKNLSPLIDPRTLQRIVTYNEEAWIDGGDVVYRTFLNGGLYDWRLRPNGQPFGNAADAQPEWRVPYPFIPLVITQHMPVGLDWGIAEGHAVVAKALELADISSNASDNIRRLLNDALIISGVAKPKQDVTTNDGDTATLGNPQPGRTKRRIIYLSDPTARLQFGTQPIDLAGVATHVQLMRDDVNEDYPELDLDLWKTGDPSGRALRVARQRTESKVQQRRTGYDESLVMAQRMALAIGGIRGYQGYRGLGSEDPLNDPRLEHAIGHRPVFRPDPLDDVEEGTAFWQMVNAAVLAGMPLEVVLEREGWPAADIKRVTDAKAAQQQAATEQVRQRLEAAGGDAMGGDQ